MKKSVLIVTAVLLAAMLAGCNDIATPEDEVVYGPNGERLVPITFNIDKGNQRSLISGIASTETDFYEVVFEKGGTAFRRTWKAIDTATINIPANFDLLTDTAVLFGGQSGNGTLLAVGRVSAVTVNGTATPVSTYPITTSTPVPKGSKVTFKMAAFDAFVSGNGGTTKFSITAPIAYITPTTGPTATLPTQAYKGVPIPVYELPAGATGTGAVTAEYLIGIGGGTLAAYSHSQYIKVRAAGKINSMGPTLDNGQKKTLIANASITNAATVGSSLASPLLFKFDTTTNGVCQIAFELPVCAMKDDGDDSFHWVIRGGLNNGVFDDGSGAATIGASADATGGSILLGIGNYLVTNKDNEIEIDGAWTF